MTTSIMVRKCQKGDCTAVLSLWKEAQVIPGSTDTVQALSCLLQHDNTAVLVAESERRLAGTVIAAWDGWRGNIYRLAVSPAYRRKGIARLLVQEAENFLVSKGAQRIAGLVDKEAPPAISFWESLTRDGFRREARYVRYSKSVEKQQALAL